MHNSVQNVLNLTSYTPNTHVNTAMSGLVGSVINGSINDFETLEPSVKQRVQSISALAETEMEKYWANKIIKSVDPLATLETFPYLDNYQELTRRELKLLKGSGLELTKAHTVLMIGSGPLPLSAYEIHRQSGAVVDHVDSSIDAIKLCEQISRVLNIESEHYHALGDEVSLYKQYDLVLVAALAGITLSDKQKIVDNILPSLRTDGRIIIRSSRGARELLYPCVDVHGLKHVELLKEYHPDDYVINSVLVYGKA